MSVTAEMAAPAVRNRTIALVVVLLAFFMEVLDSTVVNIAMPSIRVDLDASYTGLQWVVAGYSLTFALFLITGGRLGDIFGYKRMFLLGMAGFTLASCLCGIAPSEHVLIGARLLQGVAAAVMLPQVLSTVQVMFPDAKERRGIAAFYGALGGLASVVGPIVGALLISGDIFGLGWRGIFLVNLPIGVLALAAAIVFLPDAKSPHPLNVDYLGVVLIVLATGLLVYPLIEGRRLGWPAWTFLSLAVSALLFVAFGWSQVMKDRHDGSPLVVPSLFRSRAFVAGIAVNLVFFAAMAGFFITLGLMLQIGLGFAVLVAGLTTIPFSVGVGFAAAMSSPMLVEKFGRYVLTAGSLGMALGLCVILATLVRAGDGINAWLLAPGLLIAGLGMGLVVAPLFNFVLAEVPVKHAGSASGILSAVDQVGGAIGVAVIGVVFFGALATGAGPSVERLAPRLKAELVEAGLPAPAVGAAVAGFAACFADRAASEDPEAQPPSCRSGEAAATQLPEALRGKVAAVFERAGQDALHDDFVAAFGWAALVEVLALIGSALLTLFLPRWVDLEREDIPLH